MAHQALNETDLYFQARGLRAPAPKSLNTSLHLALDNMRAILYSPTIEDLTEPEQIAIRSAGLDIDRRTTAEPLMKTAVKFAAILESSFTPAEAAMRLNVSPGRLRQLIADHSLFSIRLEARRFVPVFQFQSPEATRLVPNIGLVNRALDLDLHPVEVLNWYTTANPDLVSPSDPGVAVSPLAWLKAGAPPEIVVTLATTL
jgi:hypothetical protein